METCKYEDCERPVRERGWCTSHYAHWYRRGDPTPLPTVSLEQVHELLWGAANPRALRNGGRQLRLDIRVLAEEIGLTDRGLQNKIDKLAEDGRVRRITVGKKQFPTYVVEPTADFGQM